MSPGILPVDLPVPQEFRVVHRRAARCGEERRHPGAGDAHLHHPVLPQVRLENDYAGKNSLVRWFRSFRYPIC